ncbi:aminoacyltransferase [Amedibacillus sp. YH-ame10]
MKFVELTQEEYQTYFISSKAHNFWQSIEMANMRAKKGWEIHYLGVKENEEILCACTLQSMDVYRGNKLFMALRGFLIDYHNDDLVNYFMKELIAFLKEHKCLYMKLDPYISYQQHDIDGNTIEGTFKEDHLIKVLESFGFQHQGFRTHHDDEFEPRWMSVLSLEDTSEEALLKQMQSMTRRNINFTEKTGIKVRELKRNELSILEKVVEATGNRKNFNKPDLAYYESFYDCFQEHMSALFAYLDMNEYIARIEDEYTAEEANINKLKDAVEKNPEAKKTANRLQQAQDNLSVIEKRKIEALQLQSAHGNEIPLAASMFVKYPNEVLYLFGGSYSEFHKFKGSYAIQWYAIKDALHHHVPKYNFYGISGNFSEDAQDYGVYLFKKGFHADVIELVGDFIYIGNPSAYKQYQMLRKIKHKVLRR